ncbi:hypothetical protein PUR34_05150 [Streptomyces sp. JV185]|uniref:hypothetical protein n=1 Tax=Streptomyces sp. JV185 TaxID=858638 RepID=UPI002E7974A8|nr:hypothetical protein [Streptomyces sp. JV185]MEE1767582.1 hypothetical protein [Streptomyces sp. JV185]
MATGQRDPLGSDAGKLSTDDLRGGGAPAPVAREARTEVPPTFPGEATTADPSHLPGGENETQHAPAPAAGPDAAATGADGNEPLLGDEQDAFRSRWQGIQGDFVDDPREAVSAADTLVAEVMQALARTFSDHKQGLEGQWQRGEEVPTEELRVALQRYRSFFNRLLNT